MLLTQGLISQEQLSLALASQEKQTKALSDVLVELGFVSYSELARIILPATGYPSIDLKSIILEPEIVQLLPREVALDHRLIAIARENRVLSIAMADPENVLTKDFLQHYLQEAPCLQVYYAPLPDIYAAIETYYTASEENSFPRNMAVDRNIVRIVQELLQEAIRAQASDIHLQPDMHVLTVRYRLDGLLQFSHTLSKDLYTAINVRIKLLSGIDIAESRRPQNGRFGLTIAGRSIDFRVSSHPTIHGENIVIRLLDKNRTLMTLNQLGFLDHHQQLLERLVQLPQGMILFTGPTGCGKTTTLYSLLTTMDATTRNIMTLEEPVEYVMANIRQTEIKETTVLNFSEGVRYLLRQDPDVIFIAEIRDEDTAQMALRAAMTGHLVLSTLHTNDPYAVPARLQDLGLPSPLLAGTLQAVISQRLVRSLCRSCRQLRSLSLKEKEFFKKFSSSLHIHNPSGCSDCRMTGYKGRLAIAEILRIDENLKSLLISNAAPHTLQQATFSPEHPSLLEDAMMKVCQGKTSQQELERVIGFYAAL